ncbi:MAG TPA: FAD-dependent monooxygenase [Puia sp.]|jgi:2-polyprenyl-6-methoxyphenol hydroxylase-like FAD-dependent oxidoreductase
MANHIHSPRILIIGAGPTGLTLACELARRNISFRIIDRSLVYPVGSRAKGLQPRSLEVFNDIGIAEKVLASGRSEIIFRKFNGNQAMGDIRREVFPREDTRFFKGSMIPQWRIEEILREELARYDMAVELDTELVNISQDQASVVATLRRGERVEEASFDYLVGCDGGKSTVRKTVGIRFEGETHEDEKALVGDVEIEGLVPDAWHMWSHPKYGFGMALCPFAGTKSWQLQAIAIPDADGNIPEPTLETFNKLFQEVANMPGVVFTNATWRSVYRVNIRMADKYRVGRVFIAGDAAHVHSIAGGLGMNTGIQDAYNLGWKLAAVLEGTADAALLDTYEEERLPVAAWTLNISSERHKAVLESASKGKVSLENTGTKDTTQLNLNYRYSSLSVGTKDDAALLQPGDRAPDALLPDGSWLSDLYRGAHFTVLAFGLKEPPKLLVDNQHSDRVKVWAMTDKNSAAAFGGRQGFFVIRPDGYIGLIADRDEVPAVNDYLSRF